MEGLAQGTVMSRGRAGMHTLETFHSILLAFRRCLYVLGTVYRAQEHHILINTGGSCYTHFVNERRKGGELGFAHRSACLCFSTLPTWTLFRESGFWRYTRGGEWVLWCKSMEVEDDLILPRSP